MPVNAGAEVIRAARARARALADGDSDGLRRLLHEEFRWVSHTGQSFTREEYVARNTTGPVTWRAQQLTEVRVTVVGRAAVLHAEVTDTLHGDPPGTFRMPMTQVWVRPDEEWLCLAGHAGPLR